MNVWKGTPNLLKLLQKIDREALKNERMIDCLLEFHIAEEETKSGLDWEEACRLLESDEFKVLEHQKSGIPKSFL